MSNITGAQIRAARALIRWRAEDLANASGVGIATIRRAELIDGVVTMTGPNLAAVERAFEGVGVIFVEENGAGPGVRAMKHITIQNWKVAEAMPIGTRVVAAAGDFYVLGELSRLGFNVERTNLKNLILRRDLWEVATNRES